MRCRRPGPLFAGLVLVLALAGAPAGAESGPAPFVYVTNYPLAYFTARIADGKTVVLYPDIAVGPEGWRPGAGERADMRQAALVFLNGAGYEAPDAALLSSARLVDTTAAQAARLITVSPEPLPPWRDPNSRRPPSRATWLDLSLAIAQARAIEQAMLTAGLGAPSVLQHNFDALTTDLRELDDALMALMADKRAVPVLAARPLYDYAARRYGINLRSLDWPPGGIPSGAMWLELARLRDEHPAQVMLWPEMPDFPTRQGLEERGIAVVVLPTLERWPASGDFLSGLWAAFGRLRAALAGLRAPDAGTRRRGAD